ncbi:MAG: hypothetical protein H8E87_06665, partial [FCB group bacterium]|nr:hypothetical protein [FCB group bacterium]
MFCPCWIPACAGMTYWHQALHYSLFDIPCSIFRWQPGFSETGGNKFTTDIQDIQDKPSCAGGAQLSMKIAVLGSWLSPLVPTLQRGNAY